MQRRPLVAGNWKMHGTQKSVNQLLKSLKRGCESLEIIEVAVFPPFVFLQQCKKALIKTKISWGAQDVSEHEIGAYTGEVSATMLRDFHCRYVIVGHSERRQGHGETNEQVSAKVRAAINFGIHPIICVGENKNQRCADQTLSIINEQLAVVLRIKDNLSLLEGMVIAYEPVWAVGTGKSATPLQAEKVHTAIRDQLRYYNVALAESTRIIYGGSVNLSNAAALFAMPNIDGFLVGSAALEAKQFLKIIEK